MAVSYNKLWKLLIDKKVNRQDLRLGAHISTTAIAKLSKGQNITTNVLLKIYNAIDYDFVDIMEVDRSENKQRE